MDAKLAALDADLREGLASCERDQLVTSHDAFGYLAARYGMTQVGISGLTPEAEPSPADLAEVTRFVEEHDVRTIYFETLVSPDIAEALASETGARTAVLDPIEGLTGIVGRRRLPRGDALEPREPPHRAAMPVTARQPCP